MAGNENSGGYRPTASQNGITKISGTGGNGTNGVFKGGKYGENKALSDQGKGASMAQAPTPQATEPVSDMPPMGNLLDGQGNAKPISAGMGEQLPPRFRQFSNPQENENMQVIAQNLPAVLQAAQSKYAPDSFKRLAMYMVDKAPLSNNQGMI
tara:strand:- start:1872 stop:2330 length:459 start_codon:yes stop_codon:yes gene_type:complete